MLPRRQVPDVLPDGLDDAGALVPEHGGNPFPAEVPLREMQVRVAHTCRRDAD